MFPGVRLWPRSARRLAPPLQRHDATQRSPLLVQERQRCVVAGEDQRENDNGWGIFGAIFWMTRDRSSFLFLRRATRLRRELHEVLRVCECTELARLHGGFNGTYMNLEAQPWIADFRVASALVSFPFF